MSPGKETEEHKQLKELVKSKFGKWFGPSIKEYHDSGHLLDVYTMSYLGIEIMVEIIWTPTEINFWRDISLVQTSDAKLKVVIVHPRIAERMAREFEKIVVSEAKRGSFVVPCMVDGLRLLKEDEYVGQLEATVKGLFGKHRMPLVEKIARLKSIVFTVRPIAQLISDSLEIAREMKRNEDVEWLERELYGFLEVIGSKEPKPCDVEKMPGSPIYRRIEGEVNLYFEGVEPVQQRFTFVIPFPASEVERWTNAFGKDKEVLINMDPPKQIIEFLEKHKLKAKSERMPVVVQVLSLERVLAGLRQRIHKFLTEVESLLKQPRV